MYDSEDWALTPAAQQQDPATYYQRAADAAHAAGLLLIAAPATNLAYVLAPSAPRNQKYDQYLSLGIPAAAARYANVYLAQAQGLEADSSAYASFVQRAARQASDANPDVEILSGLSTNPSGVAQTASVMLDAAAASAPYIRGWWLNDPQAGPPCPKCTGPFPATIAGFLQGLPTMTDISVSTTPTSSAPPGPTLSRVSLSPHRVSITGRRVKGTCVKRTPTNGRNKACRLPIKIKVSYTLSASTTVTFTITRDTIGRKVNGKCVKLTNRNRKRKRCTLVKRVPGLIRRRSTAGANTLIFNGRIGAQRLGLGSYTLTATPAGGTPRTVKFKVVR
jgi:hypothetical protein